MPGFFIYCDPAFLFFQIFNNYAIIDNIMAKSKYTIEHLKEFAKAKGGDCLSEVYTNSHDLYTWLDNMGNTWQARWYNILNGTWSPFLQEQKKADSLRKYTIVDLQKHAETKGGKLLSTEYQNTKTKLTWEDSKGRSFRMDWEHVLSGQWSPHEKKEKISKLKRIDDIELVRKFAEDCGGEFLSSEFTTGSIKYQWKDRNGRVFYRSWHDIKEKGDVLFRDSAKKQKEIGRFLSELQINYIENYKIPESSFEIDFYIPELRIGIEYNGSYWHSELYRPKNYHFDKFRLCQKHNIQLIQIFDTEWINKNDQVKSFLRSKLQKNETFIGARKTELRIVPKQEAKDFLNKYHIQGACAFKIVYGLYYENELVCLACFGNHHRNNKEMVLSRYVGKESVTVQGGLNKIISYYLKNNGSFSTWVDLRFSNGDNWLKLGGKLSLILPPDYFYWDIKNRQRITKQSRKKSNVSTPSDMTEHQHAKQDGLTRVYDCGKLKFSF
jgi:hypothetical protein